MNDHVTPGIFRDVTGGHCKVPLRSRVQLSAVYMRTWPTTRDATTAAVAATTAAPLSAVALCTSSTMYVVHSCALQRQAPGLTADRETRNMNIFFQKFADLVFYIFFLLCYHQSWKLSIQNRDISCNSSWKYPVIFWLRNMCSPLVDTCNSAECSNYNTHCL